MTAAANPRLAAIWAPYMEWAKSHPRPRFDLCGSNLLACTIDDLPGARRALQPSGGNDHGYGPLIEAIAARYATSEDRVCLAAGASGANFLVLASLLAPGDEVLIERPAYDPLLGAARLLGAAVTRFERPFDEGIRLDPGRVAAAITPRTRLIVVTNPHNPSGVALDDDALGSLARIAERHGLHVLVDEVYLDTLAPPAGASPSPAGQASQGPETAGVGSASPPAGATVAPAANLSDRLISTSSLTKSYGLPGLRAGWVLAAPEVAAAVRRARGTIEAIGAYPGEVLAHIAFQHLETLAERARSILEPGRAALTAFVESRDELEWVRPDGGTVGFPRLRDRDDAGPFIERLLAEHDTAVVPGRFFEAPAHFRIAFGGDPEALAGGLEQIGAALDGDL